MFIDFYRQKAACGGALAAQLSFHAYAGSALTKESEFAMTFDELTHRLIEQENRNYAHTAGTVHTQKCSNCAYWLTRDDGKGGCLRYPPTFQTDRYADLQANQVFTKATSSSHWCGEWKPGEMRKLRMLP